MKFLLVLFAILALAVAYSEIDDSMDIEAIVTNPDSLKSVINCFLDGPCDKKIAAFNKVMHEMTETACAKCTPAQKHMLKRMMQEAKKHSPEKFETMAKKYDPEGKYADALHAALADA